MHLLYQISTVRLSGEPALHQAFIQGAGLSPAAVDVPWRRRSLLYLLLHPYSNLAWFMDVAPPP